MSVSSNKDDLKQKLIIDEDSKVKVSHFINEDSRGETGNKEVKETDEEKLNKIGGPITNSFLKSNICSRLFFCWPTKLFKITKHLSLKSEYLGKIDEELSAENYSKKAISYWKNNNSKYSLFRSILNLNIWKLILFIMICLLTTGINLVNINIIQNIIIIFSNDPEKKVIYDFGKYNLYYYCGSFIFLKFFYLMIFRQGTIIEYILSYKAGIELITIIYDKILTTTLSGKKKLSSEGEIVNYIQIDAYKIISTITQSPTIITNPIQVVVYNYMLFRFFGLTYFFGLGTLLIFFGLNYLIFKGYRTYEEEYLKCKDDRMKITNQVFNHLKILKFNSWINEFKNKIKEKRESEMVYEKKILNLTIWNIFLFWTSPVLTTVITIGAYYYFKQSLAADIIFTSLNIFAGIQDPLREIPSSINSIIDLFISLKRIEKFLFQEDRDVKMIKSFDYLPNEVISNIDKLNEEESQEYIQKQKELTEDLSIKLQNCSFSWGNKKSIEEYREEEEQKIVLKNINLEVKKGAFIGIIGEVGSGKSSFLHMLLNNMMPIYLNKTIEYKDDIKIEEEENKENKESNESKDICKQIKNSEQVGHIEQNLIQIRGSLSYISQSAWIQNATIKDNILLFKEYNKEVYDKVVKVSELESDLKILSGGDLTEIGEKGINLSGGQKTRISLARAAYSNSDIYLFDDPLAALDGNVGKSVFEKLFQGYLKEKTKILVTNNINYLEYLDKIVLLKNGEIVFQGSFENFKLSNQFEEFANYLKKEPHPENANAENNKEEVEDENKLIEIIERKTSERRKSTNSRDINCNLDEEEKIKENVMNDNKLIRDEDKEIGRVKASVYLDYIRYNGGTCLILSVVIVMFFWQAFKVSSDFWMSILINGPVFKNPYYDFGIYAGLSILSSIFVFFRLKLLVAGTINMCTKVHNEMIDSLMNAPINLYHDIEPKGRILNRLSKDIEYITYIMFSVGNFLSGFFFLIGVIALCSYYI